MLAEMDRMQGDLLETARARREANSIRGVTKERFLALMAEDGGFVYGGFCGGGECEAEIKEQTKATIRVLPDEEFRSAEAPTDLHVVRRPSAGEAVWAKAY